jgi:6-pyruvoyltetrahydropterin/6-carboxytetrahydropterin synthase
MTRGPGTQSRAPEEVSMWTVRVCRSFSAAHRIHDIGGKCENVHGHNYRVEVAVASSKLNKPGMVVDFVKVGRRLESILPDHKMLNEVYAFNPTAENLARRLFEEMAKFYPVARVTVWESEDTCAEYSPD